MQTALFRLLFSLSSFLGILLFLVININFNIPYIEISKPMDCSTLMFLKYLLMSAAVIIFAKIVLALSKKFLEKSDNLAVKKIKPVEGVFLPIYIGLFVIALSFNEGFSPQTCFLILFLFVLWVLFENVAYFNPFFLFWGYRFYEVESVNDVTILVITKKKDIKKIRELKNLIRINNFTFLEY